MKAKEEVETIHAELGDEKLVRYEKAGKWGVIYLPCNMRPYRPLDRISQAVNVAMRMRDQGGRVFFGRPGGKTFDRMVKDKIRLKAENSHD